MGHGKENGMSTLEKTINLLNVLSENQIEMIYSFVQFLSSQQTKEMPEDEKSLDDILGNIVVFCVLTKVSGQHKIIIKEKRVLCRVQLL